MTTDNLLQLTIKRYKSDARLNRDEWCLVFLLSHHRNCDETVRIHADCWSDQLDRNVKPTQFAAWHFPANPAARSGRQRTPCFQALDAQLCARQDLQKHVLAEN